MSILSKVVKTGLAALAFASVATVAGAAEPRSGSSCFFTSAWRGWSSPSPDVIYIDAGSHRIYRVDLAGGSHYLKSPGTFLVNKVRGSTSICSALDLDLAVADTTGFYTPLIAQQLTLLTPEQVAAIPRKDLP